jgi:hypothetical protein
LPSSIFSADLDRDSDNDLIVANEGSCNVSIYLNNGDATFATPTDYAAVARPHSVFAADLDGDGDNDLAVANPDHVSVLLNRGDATFATTFNYGAGESGTEGLPVVSADFDGDYDYDLVVGGHVAILFNLTNNTGEHICGDASGDGQVNLGDAVFLIAYVFKRGLSPDPVCSGDTNGDGGINIGDAVYLIAHLFKDGPNPVEPCCL